MGVDRKAGKVLVLSMAYGVGPDKIAKSIGCSVAAARDLLNKFSERFKTVASYRSKVLGATRQGRPPYVTTITGRRRYLPEIFSKDPGVRAGAERQAFNTRIQGSAADIIKIAMVRAHTMLPKQAKITLTVHDELVVTTPDNLVDETVSKLREAMEGIHVLKVPLIADITVAKRWGDAK
jgi:DNA polymerase-1